MTAKVSKCEIRVPIIIIIYKKIIIIIMAMRSARM